MSNLTKRILSAAVLVPFIIYLVFFASNLVLHISLSAIAGLSAFEFCGICFGKRFFPHRISVSFFSSILAFIIPYAFSRPILLVSFLPISLVALCILFMFSKETISESLNGLSFSILALFYCGSLVSSIYLISFFNPTDGRYFIFLLLLATFLGDTGAYAFGRLFGNRKLYPKLSPGKTWAGSFGGLFMSFLSILSMKLFLIPNLSIIESVLLAIFLNLFCQIGDLAESFIKRGFGVKDSGKIIPGHGGILDRIDALLFGAPIVFLFTYLR